jgi:hypothetical protein
MYMCYIEKKKRGVSKGHLEGTARDLGRKPREMASSGHRRQIPKQSVLSSGKDRSKQLRN